MRHLFLIVGMLCFHSMILAQKTPTPNKFLPPEGKTLFIIGQDLGAIGGMDDYKEGYIDTVATNDALLPAGVTTYTGIADLGGLESLANWGSGDVNAQALMETPRFANSVLVIGLYLGGGHLDALNKGDFDDHIDHLGAWIATQKRPVFVRIGYEFDGPWNAYEPDAYVLAYQRIVDRWHQAEVTNMATVWQSATWKDGTYQGHSFMDWYPGDDYVDWFGLSYFQPHLPTLEAFLDLAREHNKPVMIAESTPQGFNLTNDNGNTVWEAWFANYFAFIKNNQDVIRAVAYINVNWDEQSMWRGQNWGDTRVQANPVVQERWIIELSHETWLPASPMLFQQLDYSASPEKK